MSELRKSHSGENTQNTRLKLKRKTVGMTLPPNLIKKARKHRLNISRITEQALNSILHYLDAQNQNESSIFLSESSFPKESLCLGSLARWGIALVRRWSRVQIPPEALRAF